MTHKSRRIVASIIDFFVIAFLSSSVIGILTLGDFTVSHFSITIYLLLFFLLFLIKDSVFKNASLGKRLCGIQIIKKDGSKLTITDMIKRNIILIILLPLEILLLVLKNNRIGDVYAKTTIIYKRSI